MADNTNSGDNFLKGDRDVLEDLAKTNGANPPRDPCGYYAALGISLHATPQEIRRAFLSLSQRYHTDKHVDQSSAAQDAMNDRFQKLMDAYAVLSDEAQRAAYDAAGAAGPDRLALVPKNMRNRQDIIGYVHALERQARLIHTAKLLAASSDINVHYSTAHLFLPRRKLATLTGQDQQSQEQAPSQAPSQAPASQQPQQPQQHAPHPGGATGTESHGGHDTATKHAAGTTASATPSPQTPHEAAPHQPPPQQPPPQQQQSPPAAQPVSAAMTAREVVVDGERQFVLIPSPEMQATLRQRMLQNQGVSATSSAQGSVRPRAKVSRTRALLFAAVPKKVGFRHTFEHPITPRLGLEIRTDATSEGQVQSISTTAALEFQRDAVRTYALTLRSSVAGLKLAAFQQRILSPIWTMRAKLTIVNGLQYLQKLELTLVRKLSQFIELENGLAWSLFQHGFFKSSITRNKESTVQGFTTYIGYHGMSISAYNVQPVVYGDDVDGDTTTAADREEMEVDEMTAVTKHSGPSKGHLEYSVNCSPFSGQTHIGFKAWYYHSPLQHFGIAFMTVIPYSVSPLAFPLFLVASPQHAVVNEVSFLYGRGRHRVSIPVIVFISPNLSRAVSWISLPLLLYRFGRLAYQPYAKAHTAARYLAARKAHVAEVDLAREKALLEQRALESSVMVSRAQEDRQGGLVIINARYGVLKPRFTEEVARPVLEAMAGSDAEARQCGRVGVMGTAKTVLRCLLSGLRRAGKGKGKTASGAAPAPTAKPSTATATPSSPAATATAASGKSSPVPAVVEEAVEDSLGEIPLTLDVTIAVQNLVRDSALALPEGTKSKLVGFCDPDPYTPEKKTLRVMYWFRKKKHMVTVDDLASLDLPQREHLVA